MDNGFKAEYSEMHDFILTLQEDAMSELEQLLSQKKEAEQRKKQQELKIQKRTEERIPNLSMFSPLNEEDFYESDESWKEELDEIATELKRAEQEYEQKEQVCASLERLRKFFEDSYNREVQESEEWAEKKDNFVAYSSRLLETQEMDRNRISRDLHDSTVQGLTSLVHKIEFCSKMVDQDPVRVKLELQTMIDLNKDIINDIREIIYDLRPMSLNNIGLVATLESYCLYLRRNDNQDVILTVEGSEIPLSSIVNVTLYRIVQEACNNSIHHSDAKKIWIRIIYSEDTVNLEVEDNGVGFNVKSLEEQTGNEILHFGLSTMRERARLLGGSLEIITEPGAGTKVCVTVPLNPVLKNEEKGLENEQADKNSNSR